MVERARSIMSGSKRTRVGLSTNLVAPPVPTACVDATIPVERTVVCYCPSRSSRWNRNRTRQEWSHRGVKIGVEESKDYG